jgi:hypothetical protein
MSELQKKTMDSASPSIQGGKGWVTLLKVLVAVLTALAGTLGLSACGRW